METLSSLLHTLRLEVTDQSHVANARRQIESLVRYSNLSDEEKGRISTVATEACTNLLKHGEGGELLLQPFYRSEHLVTTTFSDPEIVPEGVHLIALDKGSGFASVESAMEDGYSTAGSAGTGMGSMLRQSYNLRIVSAPDKGSAVLATILFDRCAAAFENATKVMEIGGVVIPLRTETVSGDALTSRFVGGKLAIMAVDGIGHGFDAHVAATTALTTFHTSRSTSPAALLTDIHHSMRATRGAAVSIGIIDLEQELLTYCGIGNVVGSIWSEQGNKRLMSYNGTVGQNISKYQDLQYPFPRSGKFIMHSDGLSSNWDLGSNDNMPAVLLASLLYRDHARSRDDASVIVAAPYIN